MKWKFCSAFTLAVCLSLPMLSPLHAVDEQAEATSLTMPMASFPQIPEFYAGNGTSPLFQAVWLENGQVRWTQQVPAYEVVRAELFDPLSGAFDNQPPLFRRLPQVALSVPNGLDITHAEFYLLQDDVEPQLLATRPASSLWIEQLALKSKPADPSLQQMLAATSSATILENGPSSNRIDVVLLGDGYTASEMAKWHEDAMTVALGFLSEPPYDSYHTYFNVHRIDVPSNESGASRADGVQRDTALGTFYNCASIQRLICGNDQRVTELVEQFTTADQRDIVVIVVNDPEYGGSGGRYAYASMHDVAIDLVLHETGHSFGRLADEYDTSGNQTPNCSTQFIAEPNVSALVSREVLKWRHWVDQTTDVPTVDGPPFNTHTPGLYRGSKYCDELYRPTPNSKMRSLGRPFDAINEEALVLRMYSVVSPIDNVFPATGTVNVAGLSPDNFVVQSPTPAAHRLMLEWYVGDQLVQTGGDFDPGRLPQGQSVVTALVYDAVAKVRRDDAGSLAGEHAWTVDKSGPEQPVTAVFDGVHNSLAIPVVQLPADNTMFQVKLQLVSDNPIRLTLTEAYPVDSPLGSGLIPQFSGTTLRIDRLEYFGEVFQANFVLTDEKAMTFELVSAELVP